MAEVLVVGSGASGVHFAATALELGQRVTMLDVGHQGGPETAPEASFTELRARGREARDYLLGPDLEAVLLPGEVEKYYGLPPSRAHVFAPEGGFSARGEGFDPMVSFARGGLGEAWTAGAYPYRDEELGEWPLSYEDLRPHYEEVARRIGVSGREDDLAPFFPVHAHLEEPVALDAHAEDLLAAYRRRRDSLRASGVHLGRSRVAVTVRDRPPRRACDRLGRCLWGCPRGALWTPSHLLEQLQGREGFVYRPGHRVRRLLVGPGGAVRGVEVSRPGHRASQEVLADRVALAAGTLGSAWILLQTLRAEGEREPRLEGLMDNRQVLVPFVNLRRVGRAHDPRSYQYHQLSFGMEQEDPFSYLHGQVTTLTTALVHPLIASLPFGVARSVRAFRDLRGALALVNVNFADRRRPGCEVSLEGERLLVHYESEAGEARRVRDVVRRFRRVLRLLGCLAPAGMVQVRPMGASVHAAGLWPLRQRSEPRSASPQGECRDFPGAYLVDGIVFPSLPAKNLTFTMMANAVRIARAHLG